MEGGGGLLSLSSSAEYVRDFYRQPPSRRDDDDVPCIISYEYRTPASQAGRLAGTLAVRQACINLRSGEHENAQAQTRVRLLVR